MITAIIASTAVAAYSVYQQGKANKRAAAERRKAREAQAKMDASKMVREKKKTVERAQRARAATLAQGQQGQGEAGFSPMTTAVAGATGSIQSQAGEQLSYLDTQDIGMGQRNAALGRAAGHQSEANRWGAYGSMAGTVFSGAVALS